MGPIDWFFGLLMVAIILFIVFLIAKALLDKFSKLDKLSGSTTIQEDTLKELLEEIKLLRKEIKELREEMRE